MKNFQHLMALILLLLMAASCEKDIAKYENDPRIYFFERTNDRFQRLIESKTYSFIAKPPSLLNDTVLIRARIMGLPAAKDRKFGAVGIAAGSNAAAGTDYKILEGTVKANEIYGYLPVVVYRTTELKKVVKTLALVTSDAGDFKAGVVDNNVFTLTWSETLVKPTNWDTRPGLSTYFGVYSLVKYQFIIDVTGMSDFPIQTGVYDPSQLTRNQMLDIKARLKDALDKYNSTHPALTDEFGLLVTFP